MAEHAVFNFDLIDISRLALEEIEKFRLCSFTEKSQRYQKLENNYHLPREIESAGLKGLFIETATGQNGTYKALVEKNIPPEDARYITSLATNGQVGLTVNARNLELMFRRFASHPLAEVQTIGKEMFDRVKTIAPSIIRHTEANAFDKDTYRELKEVKGKGEKVKGNETEVQLVEYSKDGDEKLIAALLHSSSNRSYAACLKTAKAMNKKQKESLVKVSLKNMKFYDSALREFEFVDLTFELIVSAACFGQLKRHRMATFDLPGLRSVARPDRPAGNNQGRT